MLLYLLLGLPRIKGDDVAAYVDAFPSPIPHCDMRGLPPAALSCVHLAPDGSLVHAKDLRSTAGSAKQMLMDMHLRGVVRKLRASHQLPGRWVSFLSVYTASGPATKRNYPVVGIGKRDPRQPGLLMPNPFFVAPDWWDWYSRRTQAVARKREFDKRRDVLLFRGACGPGGHERLKLMRLRTLNGAVDARPARINNAAKAPQAHQLEPLVAAGPARAPEEQHVPPFIVCALPGDGPGPPRVPVPPVRRDEERVRHE